MDNQDFRVEVCAIQLRRKVHYPAWNLSNSAGLGQRNGARASLRATEFGILGL